MVRTLYFWILIIGLFSCSSGQHRLPSSVAKLAAPGTCSSIVRVFFAPRHTLVKNVDDFLRHTSLHVERNRVLASELIAHFPEKFDLVNEELVQAFLKVHDQSKLNPSLTKNGRRFIGERLYEFYGLPDGLLSKTERAEKKSLIAELNLIDNIQVMDFFKNNGLLDRSDTPNMAARQLLIIEKVVDFVDRGSSPVTIEEFSRKVSKGSEFVDEALAPFARYLEKHYRRLVNGLEYSRY